MQTKVFLWLQFLKKIWFLIYFKFMYFQYVALRNLHNIIIDYVPEYYLAIIDYYFNLNIQEIDCFGKKFEVIDILNLNPELKLSKMKILWRWKYLELDFADILDKNNNQSLAGILAYKFKGKNLLIYYFNDLTYQNINLFDLGNESQEYLSLLEFPEEKKINSPIFELSDPESISDLE